jgi:LmbE family N-acetylglucosaminyl deacetylase
LIWEQAHIGDHPQILTICAGDPPPGAFSDFAEMLHERWQAGREAPVQRRKEDEASSAILGAEYRHLTVPDCIYRLSPHSGAHLYDSEEALFGPLHPEEQDLVNSLRDDLAACLPDSAQIVCPLALGGHVDHRLTRLAAEGLDRRLWYYAEYPYVLEAGQQVEELRRNGWRAVIFPLSQEARQAWQQAVAAYASQISSFWDNLSKMQADLRAFEAQVGGIALWRPLDSFD